MSVSYILTQSIRPVAQPALKQNLEISRIFRVKNI